MPLRKADREARARQQHNVVFEYPDHALHSAAEHDNIGLVKYALNHGQPVNGAKDGLLPLHLACAGGSIQAAQLLLDAGADPNAARLPPPRPSRSLKPSSHKEKDSPAGGAPGATPLHFAAANNHMPLVLLLLRHGARPEKADKNGATPAALARAAGFAEIARVLDDWATARDADLYERGTRLGAIDPSLSLDSLHDDDTGRRKLNVQRSIDNVFGFGRLRANSALDSPQAAANAALSSRRPSLPDPDAMMPATPPSKKSKGGGRPSSAGSGSAGPPMSTEHKPKRLGSKMSLLGLFKRPSADALNSSAASLTAPPSQSQSRSRHGSDASRPGILRPQHGRSSSGTGARLRFDPTSQSSPSPAGLDEDDEDEDFGRPVVGHGHRARSRSIASTASLSPSAHAAAHRAGEFPFSIERPPEDAEPCEGDEDDTLPRTARARDDSMSTTGSAALLRTPPGMAEVPMLHHKPSTTSLGPAALGVAIPVSKPPLPVSPHSPPLSHSPSAPLLNAHHRPRAIDLAAISTHAQAAELVQRAQASVLALNKGVEGQDAVFSGEEETDIPLSARLAAYGESLALARRLKEANGGVGPDEVEDDYFGGGETVRGKPRAFSDAPSPVGLRRPREDTFGSGSRPGKDGMVRKASRRGATVDGQGRLTAPRSPRTPPHTRRRPHTAESATSNSSGGFLAPPDASFMHHHRSRSAAPAPSNLSQDTPLAGTFGDDAPLAGAVSADAPISSAPRDDGLLSPAPAGAVASLKREEGVLGEVPTSPSPKKRSVALPSEHGSPVPKRSNSIRSTNGSIPPVDTSTSSGDLFGLKPGALERQTGGPQRANSLRSVHESPTGDLFGLKPGALERPAPVPDALAGKGSSSSSLGLKPSSSSLGLHASASAMGVKPSVSAASTNRGIGLGSSKPSLASIRDAKGSYAPTSHSIAQSFAAPPFDFDANGLLGFDAPPETFIERARKGRMATQEYERIRTPFAGVPGPTYGDELDLARMLTLDPATPGAFDDEDGMGLQRIRTAPDGGGVRRANKLARMGITPEKDVPSGGVVTHGGGHGKREKLRRWVGGLTGRG